MLIQELLTLQLSNFVNNKYFYFSLILSITAETLGMEGEYAGPHVLERKPSWLEVDPTFGRSPSPEEAKKRAFTK